MRTYPWERVSVVVLLFAVWLPVGALALTSDVFQVQATLSTVSQDSVNGVPKIFKRTVGANDLVNLAQGRAFGTTVPRNEVLAFAHDCANTATSLIVFDTNSKQNLATIATLSHWEAVQDPKKGQAVAQWEIQSVGGSANRFDGGLLVLAGQFGFTAAGCPVKLSGTVLGIIQLTFTDLAGPTPLTALVTSGKLSTGTTPIGSLITE